jgi:diguanylate cyclase (GGDEF)-like protein
MAKYDHLTGALNRCYLSAEFNRIVKRTASSNGKIALFFIDLDCFKRVNDTYGHIVGDALLQHVAGRLLNNTRHSKTRACDVVARVGGDEFVVVLSGVKSSGDVMLFADKLMDVLRKPFFIGNDKLSVTASIGVATYPDDAASIDALIDMADKAMYKIKRHGKNDYKLCGDAGKAYS